MHAILANKRISFLSKERYNIVQRFPLEKEISVSNKCQSKCQLQLSDKGKM